MSNNFSKNTSIVLTVAFIILIGITTLLWMRDYNYHIQSKIDSEVVSDYSTTIATIISFFSLLLNVAVLYIAYKAYQNFDVQKQYLNKQLDIVTALSESISDSQVNVNTFKKIEHPKVQVVPEVPFPGHVTVGYRFNIYRLAVISYSEFDKIFVMSNNIENTLPFLRFTNNPMLPRSIADELRKLLQPLQLRTSTNKKRLPNNYVVLSPTIDLDENDHSRTMFYEYYKNPTNFNEDIITLRESIVTWLKKYGAVDINI